ncbi:cheY-like receiver [Candidatus Scalindua japonica]|uniref:CheY-like receiver n=1 Tax=Candidatus Scalindua japonica TaxID=1284222 RepID=A0A286TUF9_9BACT|nr:response regulator [Candidatus Scalindua japonica]GAX59506.1 cheY-like receiver [Candidatus Scalindua japonica]
MKKEIRVLLVEDNSDDVIFILNVLKAQKNICNDIDVVTDGAEALDYLFKERDSGHHYKHILPTFIIMDIKLPKVNGLEVLQKIRADERTAFIPVILLTSSTHQGDLINGYKYGCNSYVSKPIEFEQFAETVKNIGLYWSLVNETPSL